VTNISIEHDLKKKELPNTKCECNFSVPCCGRKGALAIGGGTAPAMAIVTSALMSDHQKYISQSTLTGFFLSPQNKKNIVHRH
jgi:hypothetical protein